MATDRKAKARQFRTHVNIPADRRTQLIELLNLSLASVFDLYSQTKQAHWNVKGEEFYQLHELFDEIAGELIGFVDEIAERAVALEDGMGTAMAGRTRRRQPRSLPGVPARRGRRPDARDAPCRAVRRVRQPRPRGDRQGR